MHMCGSHPVENRQRIPTGIRKPCRNPLGWLSIPGGVSEVFFKTKLHLAVTLRISHASLIEPCVCRQPMSSKCPHFREFPLLLCLHASVSFWSAASSVDKRRNLMGILGLPTLSISCIATEPLWLLQFDSSHSNEDRCGYSLSCEHRVRSRPLADRVTTGINLDSLAERTPATLSA